MALEPITRKEKIIAGKDLEPITRLEKFLKEYGGCGGSGGGGSPDAVLYTAQTLTDAQKKQARYNIDAAVADFVVNGTQNSSETLTLDKTFTQIREAALEGKSVLMRVDAGESYSYVPLINVGAGYCVFAVSVSEEDSIALQTISVTSDNVVTLSISRALAFYSDGTLPQATMGTDPILPMEIATKKYVDDKECILKSTTPGSTKKFKITVDDSGTIKATEVT